MPIQKVVNGRIPVKIWTTDIESEAIDQLRMLTELPFIQHHVAAMPDVHAGRGSTVGSVIATVDCVIPATVGADLGCGMMAVKTPFKADQVQGQVKEIRHSIERSIPIGKNWNTKELPEVKALSIWDSRPGITQFGAFYEGFDAKDLANVRLQLGSLGGGNHFIELCLDKEDNVWLMLHSGSRNVGKRIGEYYVDLAKKKCAEMHIKLPHPDLAYLPMTGSIGAEYQDYLKFTQEFAAENRKEMMRRALRDLAYIVTGKFECERLFEVNCHHNYIALENHFGKNLWITRKGAIRARTSDYGIIPGSMGAKSFIVHGLGNADSFHSASHGAGRKMSRTEAKKRFTKDDLQAQTQGVECRKDEGVIDEIPAAYKSIDDVMENQKDLVEVVAELRQIMCIKG